MLGKIILLSSIQRDGYPENRKRVTDHLSKNMINNTVLLTGDIHASFAFDITTSPYDRHVYNPVTGDGSIAVELVSTSVTSGFTSNSWVKRLFKFSTPILKQLMPQMLFSDLVQRGVSFG